MGTLPFPIWKSVFRPESAWDFLAIAVRETLLGIHDSSQIPQLNSEGAKAPSWGAKDSHKKSERQPFTR